MLKTSKEIKNNLRTGLKILSSENQFHEKIKEKAENLLFSSHLQKTSKTQT